MVKQQETPRNYKEAKDNEEWMKAMRAEYEALINNNTWTLTELPTGRTAISSKWTYRIKYNSDGTIAKYKARLVARGFTQQEGVDFNETFAPVIKQQSLRFLLAIAVQENMKIHHIDVTTAFLYGEIEEDIYI